MRKWVAAALLIVGAMSVPLTAQVVGAQAPDAQGWWWLYKQAELPADPKSLVPQFPGTPELPSPASVPADGLYVAGGAQGPEGISALSWVIPEGASADTLTLTAATPLTPTTSIRICANNASWQPVQGGRWSSKPLFQCATDAPVGVVPADGTKITFSLGKLGQQRLIDVSLVPSDAAVFQANFNKPDKTALTVIPGASADSSAGGTGAGVLGSTGEPNSLNRAVGDSSFMPALTPFLQPSGDESAGAAPIVDFAQGQQQQQLQPSAAAPTTVAATSPKDNLETFGIFGLIALAALFSRFRNQPAHEPKSLVNFGKGREAEVS